MKIYLYLLVLLLSLSVFSQGNIPQALKKLNKETVPYITYKELEIKKNLVYLDARELKEFEVSHIKNATYVGYDNFKPKNVTNTVKDKEATLVVYCSIGVRSERIGEKLLKLGYKNVYNLYGGIFDYKNSGGKVVNNHNQVTDSVHAYNKEWSVYLNKGIKIYEN